MSIASKIKSLFKRNKDNGRISFRERYEASEQSNLTFFTPIGGSYPIGFDNNTQESKDMQTEPLRMMQELIAQGCIDADSEAVVQALEDAVDYYCAKGINNIEKQAVIRNVVAEEIYREARGLRHIEKRNRAKYIGERNIIDDITEYREEEFDYENDEKIQKGLGD